MIIFKPITWATKAIIIKLLVWVVIISVVGYVALSEFCYNENLSSIREAFGIKTGCTNIIKSNKVESWQQMKKKLKN